MARVRGANLCFDCLTRGVAPRYDRVVRRSDQEVRKVESRSQVSDAAAARRKVSMADHAKKVQAARVKWEKARDDEMEAAKARVLEKRRAEAELLKAGRKILKERAEKVRQAQAENRGA